MSEEVGLKVRISGDTSELQESLEAGKEALGEFGINVDKITQFLTGGAGLAIALAGVAKEGIEAAMQFEGAMQSMGRSTGLVGPDLQKLSENMHNVMGSGVEQDVNQISAGMAQLAIRFHASGTELESLTKTFAEYADITNQQVGPAVENISKVLSKFGLEAKDTESVLDKITFASQATGMSAQTLGMALQENGAIFKSANMDINESIALLAGFEQGGVDSGKAMFGLRSAIQGFQKDGLDAGEELKKLIEHIKNASSAELAAKLATDHFGRGAQEMLQAIRSGNIDIEGFSKKLEGAEGALKKTADGTKTTEETMKELSNMLTNLASEAFGGLVSAAKPVIDIVKGLVQWFEALPGPIKQTIEVTGLLVGALKVASVSAALFGASFEVALGPIGLIIAAVTALGFGIKAIADHEREYNESLSKNVELAKENLSTAEKTIGKVTDLNKNQKLNEDQVAKLIVLYPELTDKLKAGNTTLEEAAEQTKKLGDANLHLNASLALQKTLSDKKQVYFDIDALQQQIKSAKDAMTQYRINGDAEGVAAEKKEIALFQETILENKKKLAALTADENKYRADSLWTNQQLTDFKNNNTRNTAEVFHTVYTELSEAEKAAAAKQIEYENQVTAVYIENAKARGAAVEVEAETYAEAQKEKRDAFAKYSQDIENSSRQLDSMMAGSFKTTGNLFRALTTSIEKDFKNMAKVVSGIVQALFSTINNVIQSNLQNSLASVDAETQAKEVAAGVQQATAVQTAQVAVDQAQATYDANQTIQNQQTLTDAKAALTRAKIEEDAAKQKAKLNYDAAMATWELQMVSAAAAAALAIINIWSNAGQLGPIAGPIVAGIETGIIAGITGAEIGIMAANKPRMPSFATGTNFAPGGMALVGERGPELVNLPRGSQVKTAAQTKQAMGGNTYNFYSPTTMDAIEMRRQLDVQQRHLAFRQN